MTDPTDALRQQEPSDADLAAHLRYVRGLLRKASASGASFVDVNAASLRYLAENRRHLNDRIRWADQRSEDLRIENAQYVEEVGRLRAELMRRQGIEQPQAVTALDVAIADVVACFTKWDKSPDTALDMGTIDALHDLVAAWKAHREQQIAAQETSR